MFYLDEVLFEASGGGGGWRLVRRPKGAPRHDPQYCLRRFKRPRKIMALAGITSEGTRFLEFLKPNQMMNSDLYCKLRKKKAFGGRQKGTMSPFFYRFFKRRASLRLEFNKYVRAFHLLLHSDSPETKGP